MNLVKPTREGKIYENMFVGNKENLEPRTDRTVAAYSVPWIKCPCRWSRHVVSDVPQSTHNSCDCPRIKQATTVPFPFLNDT
jgi:hypothetical protein